MLIPGEIMKRGRRFAAMVELFAAYAEGKTRKAACESLAIAIQEIAGDHRPLGGFRVRVIDGGKDTIFVSANDPSRLLATLFRLQRQGQGMSLADVAEVMGAKSRNGYAQYEQGQPELSLRKLEELLAAVAPDLAVAIIPRNATVRPSEEEPEYAAEIDALLRDPSPATAAALLKKYPPRRAARKVG